MKNDVLTPFTNAACNTLKLLLDVDALAEAARVIEACPENTDQIDVVIGITGDLDGEVLYRFPTDTTLEIVKMMSGMEFTEVDEFVTSALGEIANIISGNAVTDLSQKDITCDILPPKIMGEEKLVTDEGVTYLFSTKINTSIGDVEVLLQTRMA
jgi:Predicted inhibitor of MCP methylation, homolog of CheC